MPQSAKADPETLKIDAADFLYRFLGNLLPGKKSRRAIIQESIALAPGQKRIYADGEERIDEIGAGPRARGRLNGSKANSAGRRKLHWSGPEIAHSRIFVIQR